MAGKVQQCPNSSPPGHPNPTAPQALISARKAAPRRLGSAGFELVGSFDVTESTESVACSGLGNLLDCPALLR